MAKETTVSLLTRAKDFGSAQASVTVAISDSRTLRPAVSGISSASQVVDGAGAAQRADRLVAVAELGVAAGHVGVDGRAARG